MDAVANDVADHQGDTGPGERNHVEPVAAHPGDRIGRQVAAGDLDGRLLGESLRQQAALQSESCCPLVGVSARVIKRQCSSGGEFLR
jgi:hypothetical protein